MNPTTLPPSNPNFKQAQHHDLLAQTQVLPRKCPLSHNLFSNPPLKRRKRTSSVFLDPHSFSLEATCGIFHLLHLNGLRALSCAGLEVPDREGDGGGGKEGDAQEEADQELGEELGSG